MAAMPAEAVTIPNKGQEAITDDFMAALKWSALNSKMGPVGYYIIFRICHIFSVDGMCTPAGIA